MKKSLLTLFFAFVAMSTWAEDAEIDGIYYNLDSSAKTAEVTYGADRYEGSVSIPSSVTYNGVTYSVTSIGYYAFRECSGLTSVTIPNSVTSVGNGAFYKCSALTSVTIPNSVTSIGSFAFEKCSGLTSVTIPNSVTSIGSNAFKNCDNVKQLIYADGCTTVLQTYLTSITSVTIPNSVTSIEYEAFYRCSALTSVTIPNSVTSIGSYAFDWCSGLTSVTIPNSVTSIGDLAFANCSGLTDVYCYAESVPETGLDVFHGSPIEGCLLHVPSASVESYRVADQWKDFYQIVALTDQELGIESPATSLELDAPIYDIQGRQHETLQKGINIVGGKKILVK